MRATSTTAYRWVFGEGDGLPGIIVDLYGEFAVIQTYVESVAVMVPSSVVGKPLDEQSPVDADNLTAPLSE